MTWATKYIGLPFAEKGRGPTHYDCWGLTRRVLKDELGIEMEPFSEIGTFDGPAVEAKVKEVLARNDWSLATMVKPFDVALMWTYQRSGLKVVRTLSHIGVVVMPGRLLHIDGSTSCVCVRFSKLEPAFKLHGFYRHRSLV